MRNFAKLPAIATLVTLGCLLCMCGCEGSSKSEVMTVKLSGTIKVDGIPVETGRIRFSPTMPEQGQAANGEISAGQYCVENVPVGKVVVTFTGSKKTGRTTKLFNKTVEESINAIPTKYSRGLTIDISNNDNANQDFNLTSR